MNKQKLKITHLYSDLMNLYGDYGNILTLKKRLEWRDIDAEIIGINLNEDIPTDTDILFVGGGQDKEQQIIADDLQNKKGEILELFNNDKVILSVCGGYQLFGKYYEDSDGNILKGIEIFDSYTKHYGDKLPRCVGNILIESSFGIGEIVGFENHGGRTYFPEGKAPLGYVIDGFGNNGSDKTEGEIKRNCFGTYIHGSILPKNPKFADYLLQKALEIKYKDNTTLKELDDSLESTAFNIAKSRKYIVITSE